MLATAAALDPSRAHYAYVYAIALNSARQQDAARHVLEASNKRHPADRETLTALVSLARDAGDQPAAAAIGPNCWRASMPARVRTSGESKNA